MKRTLTVLAIAATVTLAGCSTTQNVITGSKTKTYPMTAACFKSHGGKSADMDEHIKRGLENHGLKVVDAPCDNAKTATDVTVSYEDTWWWDVVMYLKNVNIHMYAPNGDLIASGRWENSPLHQFPGADGIVQGLLDQMFVEAGAPGALRTTKQAAQ